MPIEIRKAERKKAKLRLGLAGPSGAGKTMSALKMAHGMGGKICMIDTERGSGDLYSDLFDYDIITLEQPFKPEKYVEAIQAAESAGYDIIIIDSLSHAWSDEGGLLDQADKLSKQSGNRFTVWADLTPQHRKLVNGMLNSTKHIIATVRSKQDYALEEYTDKNGSKRSKPVKLGMAPVQREGMEYEFTVFLDIDIAHNATASKDRTNSFKDEIFVIDESVGQRLMAWLNSGKTDTLALKKELVGELHRLGLGIPLDKDDAAAFIREAAIKLTGLEINGTDDNLEAIIAALKVHQDPAKVQTLMYGHKEPPQDTPPASPQTPSTPPPTAPESQEPPKPQGEAPIAPESTPRPILNHTSEDQPIGRMEPGFGPNGELTEVSFIPGVQPTTTPEERADAQKIAEIFGGEVKTDGPPPAASITQAWKELAHTCTTTEDARKILSDMREGGESPMQIGMVRGILVVRGLLKEPADVRA